MQESHDQRAEQKRRGSELVNLSEIVPCAKGQMSMQNNQLSHTRWDRDQLFRNCFSNPFQRPRKAPVQNENIALNVLGWNGRVTVYRISENPKEVSRINLLMTTSEDS